MGLGPGRGRARNGVEARHAAVRLGEELLSRRLGVVRLRARRHTHPRESRLSGIFEPIGVGSCPSRERRERLRERAMREKRTPSGS